MTSSTTPQPLPGELVVEQYPNIPQDDFGKEQFVLFWLDASHLQFGKHVLRGQVFYSRLDDVLTRHSHQSVRYITSRPDWAVPKESK